MRHTEIESLHTITPSLYIQPANMGLVTIKLMYGQSETRSRNHKPLEALVAVNSLDSGNRRGVRKIFVTGFAVAPLTQDTHRSYYLTLIERQ